MSKCDRLFASLGLLFPNRIRATVANGSLTGITGPYPFLLLESIGEAIRSNCPAHTSSDHVEPATLSTLLIPMDLPDQPDIVVRYVHFVHDGAAPCETLALTVGPPDLIGHLAGHTWDTSRLSQREAQLALGLAAGRSLQDLAREHRVSINTVRNHVKNAMRATGTHSQVHLTWLIRDWLV